MSRIALLLLLLIPCVSRSQWTPLITAAPQLAQESLSNSTLVIDDSGRLWVTGGNEYGQLGLGTTTEVLDFTQVQLPAGGARWTRVAAGASHAIALADSDKLYSWGDNRYGQLGTGNRVSSSAPVRISNPSVDDSWRSVSAGFDHSLAINSRGELYAWGANDRGQLGTGDTLPFLLLKRVPVPGGSRYWTAAAAGDGFSIGVTDRGRLYEWGSDSMQPRQLRPQLVARGYRGYSPLPTLAASHNMFAAMSTNGGVSVWGRHAMGWQFRGFQVALGEDHFAALYVYGQKGYVGVGGGNGSGQYGDGTKLASGASTTSAPKDVWGWVAVSAGLRHTFAIGSDGNLYVWGDNGHGQLGTGNRDASLVPKMVRRVCAPLRLTASLAAPSDFPGAPFPISALVRDTSDTRVKEVSAHLVAYSTLWIEDAPDVRVRSQLSVGDSASAIWSVNGDSVNGLPSYDYFFSYIVAEGSAPAFASGSITVQVKRGTRPILGDVVDSTTSLPIPGATVYSKQVTDTTSTSGSYRIGAPGASTVVTATHDNHRSASVFSLIPYLPDTLSIHFALDSSAIIGRFNTIDASATFDRIFFCDSAIAYAIRGDSVFRTDDAATTWHPVFQSLEKLHALAFQNVDEGWVVGDLGVIAHTRDGGKTWLYESAREGGPDLYGVACANGWTWAVGDLGTILMKPHGERWVQEVSYTTRNFRAVHAFDRYAALVVGEAGSVYTRAIDRWFREPVGPTNTFTSCYMVSTTRAYLADSAGGTYSIDPLNLYSLIDTARTGTITPVNSLFFLNPTVGWAVGDDGASVVTYDSAETWALVPELATSQRSLDFWSVTGYSLGTRGLMRYDARAASNRSIVRGRLIDVDGITGLSGAILTLHGADGVDRITYSNHKGNYVFTDVPVSATTQTVDVVYWDTTGYWRPTGGAITAKGKITTIDFERRSASVLSEEPQRDAFVVYDAGRLTIFTGAPTESLSVSIYDVLGRRLIERSLPGSASGTVLDLHDLSLARGTYVAQIASGGHTQFCRFQISR